MKLQIKQNIQTLINTKYNGSFRFLRKNNVESLLGKESLEFIRSTLDPELHEPVSLMLYCFLNDIYTHPKCICGNLVKFNTTRKEFGSFCSPECRYTNYESTVNKRISTCLEKYGTTSYLNSEEGKQRTKQVCLEKYGVDNFSKTDEFKKLRKEW